MGYLDNSTVTVDAILTNKGREILAAGGRLNITKFALSDDEIDYDLWNPAHTLGTNYYGAVIENMPVLEALPDESQMLRYKLVTLPKDAIGIPVIDVIPAALTFTSLTSEITVTPSTVNMQGGNDTLGYTVILSDDTVATLAIAPNGGVSARTTNTTETAAGSLINMGTVSGTFLDDEITSSTTAGKTITVVGKKFIVRPKTQADLTTVKRALLTIIGNETGGFKTITITVDPTNFLTQNVTMPTPPSPRGGDLGA
jgi:hypothetical protein